MAVFWVVAPCCVVEVYRRFGWKQQVTLKRRWTSTILHSATTQKTAVFILAAMRTWSLTFIYVFSFIYTGGINGHFTHSSFMNTEVRSPTEVKDFSSTLCVQTGPWAHPASCTVGTGGSFPGGKARPGRDADHSPPSRAIPPVTQMRLYGA
jgi:hypothetical protein